MESRIQGSADARSQPYPGIPNPRSATMLQTLIVEDDETFLIGLSEVVRKEGFTVSTASDLAEARNQLAKGRPDVLLVDVHLPDGLGLDLLGEFEDFAGTEVILITGQASLETAVEALRHGAADYLTKPVDFARLKMALGNVSRTRALKREIGELRGELRKLGRFGSLIGGSAPMPPV